MLRPFVVSLSRNVVSLCLCRVCACPCLCGRAISRAIFTGASNDAPFCCIAHLQLFIIYLEFSIEPHINSLDFEFSDKISHTAHGDVQRRRERTLMTDDVGIFLLASRGGKCHGKCAQKTPNTKKSCGAEQKNPQFPQVAVPWSCGATSTATFTLLYALDTCERGTCEEADSAPSAHGEQPREIPSLLSLSLFLSLARSLFFLYFLYFIFLPTLP